jgi:hypothetical protein
LIRFPKGFFAALKDDPPGANLTMATAASGAEVGVT